MLINVLKEREKVMFKGGMGNMMKGLCDEKKEQSTCMGSRVWKWQKHTNGWTESQGM